MRRFALTAAWLLESFCCAPLAQAQALWVGDWFRVPEATRRSAHSFTLATQPDGELRYDNGGDILLISPGKDATPEPFQPQAAIRTLEFTPVSFSYEEVVAGKPVSRVEARLSPDRRRLIGRRVSIAHDGQERARETLAKRIGSGIGLVGRWRELPPSPGLGNRGPQQPGSPFWVISQDVEGTMTWTIPQTGEVLKGKADGRPYPVSGSNQLPGRTFMLKTLSSRHLRWSFYENGHLVEHADERLSADGKLWTDLVWKPAHSDEKDRFVYRRE